MKTNNEQNKLNSNVTLTVISLHLIENLLLDCCYIRSVIEQSQVDGTTNVIIIVILI